MSAMLPIPGRDAERRIFTVAGVVTLATGAAWGVTTGLAWLGEQISSRLEALTFGPSLPIALSAALLLAGWGTAYRTGHKTGRMKQRRVHAFAVWKGHPR